MMVDFLRTNQQMARNDRASISREIPDDVLRNLEALGYIDWTDGNGD